MSREARRGPETLGFSCEAGSAVRPCRRPAPGSASTLGLPSTRGGHLLCPRPSDSIRHTPLKVARSDGAWEAASKMAEALTIQIYTGGGGLVEEEAGEGWALLGMAWLADSASALKVGRKKRGFSLLSFSQ